LVSGYAHVFSLSIYAKHHRLNGVYHVLNCADKRSGEQDFKLPRNARKGAGAGGSMSDDEPLYDSVCSDEDYASIGDNHSVKEDSAAGKAQASSSKETIDTMVKCCCSYPTFISNRK